MIINNYKLNFPYYSTALTDCNITVIDIELPLTDTGYPEDGGVIRGIFNLQNRVFSMTELGINSVNDLITDTEEGRYIFAYIDVSSNYSIKISKFVSGNDITYPKAIIGAFYTSIKPMKHGALPIMPLTITYYNNTLKTDTNVFRSQTRTVPQSFNQSNISIFNNDEKQLNYTKILPEKSLCIKSTSLNTIEVHIIAPNVRLLKVLGNLLDPIFHDDYGVVTAGDVIYTSDDSWIVYSQYIPVNITEEFLTACNNYEIKLNQLSIKITKNNKHNWITFADSTAVGVYGMEAAKAYFINQYNISEGFNENNIGTRLGNNIIPLTVYQWNGIKDIFFSFIALCIEEIKRQDSEKVVIITNMLNASYTISATDANLNYNFI